VWDHAINARVSGKPQRLLVIHEYDRKSCKGKGQKKRAGVDSHEELL
jgi:hypothetical protein